MRVTVRERKVKDGKISFYLDIYHNGKCWAENLGLTIQANSIPNIEEEVIRDLAQIFRAVREFELKHEHKPDFATLRKLVESINRKF